ncbi:MAG: hypothetical protein ABI591_19325 [Kofleriaceae bacterium]
MITTLSADLERLTADDPIHVRESFVGPAREWHRMGIEEQLEPTTVGASEIGDAETFEIHLSGVSVRFGGQPIEKTAIGDGLEVRQRRAPHDAHRLSGRSFVDDGRSRGPRVAFAEHERLGADVVAAANLDDRAARQSVLVHPLTNHIARMFERAEGALALSRSEIAAAERDEEGDSRRR